VNCQIWKLQAGFRLEDSCGQKQNWEDEQVESKYARQISSFAYCTADCGLPQGYIIVVGPTLIPPTVYL
jgi:hypothetical protein